jgi:hypothetical protein
MNKLKELLSLMRRSFVVLSRTLFKTKNTKIIILIISNFDIV